jgi:hypothetical protein
MALRVQSANFQFCKMFQSLNFDEKLRVEIYQKLMFTHALRHLYSSDLNLNPK